ncbi:MAG: MarR family winged helix-turn-helix transcriptional regulator [Clostridium sp.]
MDRKTDFQNAESLRLIRIIGLKLKLKADQDIKKLGLNSIQGSTLDYISTHQHEGLIQRDIAEAFNKKSATITSMLQGLEKKGYIERFIPKDNERQKNIYLTQKGEQIIFEAKEILQNLENDFYDILTDEELSTLTKILIKINNNI